MLGFQGGVSIPLVKGGVKAPPAKRQCRAGPKAGARRGFTIAELARLIKTQEVSPVEVIEAHLERIERLNTQLHAFLTVCHEDARRAASAAAHEMAHGAYRGPLHGIPFAVKDQLSTRGIRTTAGSPLFGDFVPDEDATVIARLQQAGAILLEKLNMTEFGTTGFSHQFSTPRNPWDLERYTGGSSSGSGAATAAGLCATSLDLLYLST